MVAFQSSFSLRTSSDCLVNQVVEISDSSLMDWRNAGQWTLLGGLSMPSTGSLSEGAGFSSLPSSRPRLTDVLELDVPAKYSLSPRAAAGILKRAERRQKLLPPHLEAALLALAATLPEPSEGVPATGAGPTTPTA